jgi:FkbH-like protein
MNNILNYPFKSKELFTKRKRLKKDIIALKKNHKQQTLKIAILGGATVSDLIQTLELMLLQDGYTADFYQSEYNRFVEEILFDTGELWSFNPDIIYIHTTYRNIQTHSSCDSLLDFNKLVDKEYEKYEKLWEVINKKSDAVVIQNNFELPPLKVYGNLSCSDFRGKIKLVNHLNDKFVTYSTNKKNIFINDINYLSSLVGLEAWYASTYWYNYKFAYGPEATPYVARSFTSIVNAIKGNSKKCLVLDLDNTLWGGVIGDEGMDGIKLGQGDAIGESYIDFQKYIKELSQRGIILAVCSKNDFETAKEGFAHPDSILKMEDFSSFHASWGLKTEALKLIANELNIGLDSIVFVDDNPVEREFVRKQLPMVLVPEIGSNIAEYPYYIDRSGYFESAKILEEDIGKISYYKNNKKREENLEQFESYESFLRSLKMSAEIKPFEEIYLDRIRQLLNKTNQFNLTTTRVDIKNIKKMIDSTKYITLSARLKDSFGDNGLVSVIYGDIIDNQVNIKNWVMSCRVFKRGLEYAIFNEFINLCKTYNIKSVKGEFVPTKKNLIVSTLYKTLGFKESVGTKWMLEDINNYSNVENFIRVES